MTLNEFPGQRVDSTDRTMKGEPLRSAVFLDRDGTIVEDCGDLSDPSQVAFYQDTIWSLRRLAAHFALFIVTNQPGVERGTISLADVQRVNGFIEKYLGEQDVSIAATYVCPHQRASGCVCIKPNPYFLRQAERDFLIDLRRSFVVGDHPHDVDLAVGVGATGIYLLSGHGRKHRGELRANCLIAEGIRDATELIMGLLAKPE